MAKRNVDRDNGFELTPFRVVLIAVVLCVCGIIIIPFLSVQLNPPPRSHGLQVTYSLPGGTPNAVESGVTAPLERILSSVEGLQSIDSRSTDNGGRIQLLFSENFDIDKARLEVSARIRQAYENFPPRTSFPVIHYQSEFQSEQRLLTFAVNSTLTASGLTQFLNQNLLPEITAQTGVSSAQIFGAPENEIHLVLDPGKLNMLQLHSADVINSIRTATAKMELGKVMHREKDGLVEPAYLIYAAEGTEKDPLTFIPDIPVIQQSGRIVYVRDVARLYEREASPSSYYRINGLQSVNLSVSAERSANLIQLAANTVQIVEKFESENRDLIDIFESYNAADYLEAKLTSIVWRSVATLVILLFFVVILYRNIRQVAVILSSLVFTMLLSFLFYYLLGLSLHLYSIAGLTLSMGIILDNILVMSDHLRRKGNIRIFLAILAATVTTIGAMGAIFLLEKDQRENLVDFFMIFSINLTMSLVAALFLIPALTQLLGVRKTGARWLRKPGRIWRFNRIYGEYSRFVNRRKWVVPLVLVLAFGLPFFMLPTSIDQEGKWATRYNAIQENEIYSEYIRPFMDEWLGGTFRLFYNHRDRFFFGAQRREETKLYLQAQMPPGGTLRQLNEVMLRIESFLKTFPGIRQFQLNINSPQFARLEMLFYKDAEDSGFPYQLKDELISFAVSSGSADFRVWGVGDAFNNVLPGEHVSNHIVLSGYNYDQIWDLARSSKKYLEQHPRIREVFINSDVNVYIPEDYYYYMEFRDPAFLLRNDLHLGVLYNHLNDSRRDFGLINYWPYKGRQLPIRVIQDIDQEDRMWSFLHQPILRDSSLMYRHEDVFELTREQGSTDIVRHNQAYQLVLEYDFIGNYRLGQKVLEEGIEQIQASLPLGYQVESRRGYYGRTDEGSNILVIILSGILFVWILGSILFNSFRQSVIPMLMIPFSYVGIFLVTHFFDFQFGQGGLASFLLVGGLSVNAALFILNDYNQIRSQQPHLEPVRAYLKAYNGKIIPILLMILSTVLGLLPFVLFSNDDPFWYSLALCTIGGMMVSLFVLVLFLPVFLKQRPPEAPASG